MMRSPWVLGRSMDGVYVDDGSLLIDLGCSYDWFLHGFYSGQWAVGIQDGMMWLHCALGLEYWHGW